MLSNEQITWIVDKVNEKINVPIIGERAEAKFIRKGIERILKLLEENLPEEVFQLLDDAAAGVEPSEDLQGIKENTVDFLNKEINLPIVGEEFEKTLFTEVVDLIFDALQKGKKLGE
jgi:hypothetical protein